MRTGEEKILTSLGCHSIDGKSEQLLAAIEILSGADVQVSARILQTVGGVTRLMATEDVLARTNLYAHRRRIRLATVERRHSIGLVNPSSVAIAIRLQRSDKLEAQQVILAPGSSAQLFNFLAGAAAKDVTLTATSEGAFYLYDSAIEVQTGRLTLTPGDTPD